MNFYAYHMMQRNNFNTILRAGRLFHQYVVDQYAKLEQQRLNYCLFHQKELRSELYQGLADAVQAGDTDGKHTGKKLSYHHHLLAVQDTCIKCIKTQWLL